MRGKYCKQKTLGREGLAGARRPGYKAMVRHNWTNLKCLLSTHGKHSGKIPTSLFTAFIMSIANQVKFIVSVKKITIPIFDCIGRYMQ